ncbi:MAG: hypothetical protein EPN85_06285 [Bacteroidetes bacterium]|nr:MAG: hypothetical protein EPN85_06285 [Bacteroidota bacterium]
MNEEEVIYLLKILEIALIASVKFVLAPFEAERYGFNFRDAFLITTSGGITGIIAFTFVGQAISYGWKMVKGVFKKRSARQNSPKKIFTRSNRFIVRIKMRFGLIGLAITTPAVISIPFGTIVTNHFYRKKMRNALILILSVIIWSLVLNGLAQYLKLSQYLH